MYNIFHLFHVCYALRPSYAPLLYSTKCDEHVEEVLYDDNDDEGRVLKFRAAEEEKWKN